MAEDRQVPAVDARGPPARADRAGGLVHLDAVPGLRQPGQRDQHPDPGRAARPGDHGPDARAAGRLAGPLGRGDGDVRGGGRVVPDRPRLDRHRGPHRGGGHLPLRPGPRARELWAGARAQDPLDHRHARHPQHPERDLAHPARDARGDHRPGLHVVALERDRPDPDRVPRGGGRRPGRSTTGCTPPARDCSCARWGSTCARPSAAACARTGFEAGPSCCRPCSPPSARSWS